MGIVSHGDGCAEPGKPGIYTRLSYYYDWINDILKDHDQHLEPNLVELSTTEISSTTSSDTRISTTPSNTRISTTPGNTLISTTSNNTSITTNYPNYSTTTATENRVNSTKTSRASDFYKNYFLLLVLSLFFNLIYSE